MGPQELEHGGEHLGGDEDGHHGQAEVEAGQHFVLWGHEFSQEHVTQRAYPSPVGELVQGHTADGQDVQQLTLMELLEVEHSPQGDHGHGEQGHADHGQSHPRHQPDDEDAHHSTKHPDTKEN